MTEPWFWRADTAAARAVRFALGPAAALYGAGQALRRAVATPAPVGVPVLCVGNASVGGTGKTPFCLLLQKLLADVALPSAFLTRGYRGALRGPVLVERSHTFRDVGDEALLLAAAAPTIVAKNRAAGAATAAKAGARVLIMDDGFQNPNIEKTLSFLLVAGDEGGLALFPAGPMRERLSDALRRADAVVAAGPAPRLADIGRKRLFLVRTDIIAPLEPQPVVAFCGVARPQRFFAELERKGFALRARTAFGDHHAFTPAELAALRAQARSANAPLVTTWKDYMRLAAADRDGVAPVRLEMTAEDPQALVRFVRERTGL